MKCSQPSLPWLFSFLFCTAHVLQIQAITAHTCSFPEYLQWQKGKEEFNWYSRIRNGRDGEMAFSFRHDVMEVSYSMSSLKDVRWQCAMAVQNKFLVMRRDPDTLHERCACVKFFQRSRSIVQIMWSKENEALDPELCEDSHLVLDPWPLVSFTSLLYDSAPSPFQGGFSMRITDSETGENSCNYMHRPMKIESDCLAGEGVILDFIAPRCVPEAGRFLVQQRTLPVAAWGYKGNHYVVLRRQDSQDLYCLRLPTVGENHLSAFLFTDLACLTEGSVNLLNVPHARGVRYLVLHLQRDVYRHLCDDEYPQCSAVSCNQYTRHECQKSCEVCEVTNPPPACSFPRRFQGQWHQTDIDGLKHVNITDTEFTIDKLGTFRCLTYPDSPPRKTRMFTTVSMFQNGCRPRFTCVQLKRLGPSVLRYSLSQSHVWPPLESGFGAAVCASSQFEPDPEPTNDLYRSHEDSGKPIVHDVAVPQRVHCNLSSSFTIKATLPNGSHCTGSLFQLCDDPTRLSFQFHPGCGEMVHRAPISSSSWSSRSETSTPFRPSSMGYFCVARYAGHYWEQIVLLQNEREMRDVRCLVFTQLDVTEALVMVSAQCDQNSWKFFRAGIREPLMFLRLQPDEFPCRYLPKTTTTTTTSTTTNTTTMVTTSATWSDEKQRLYSLQNSGSSGRSVHAFPISFTESVVPSHPNSPHRISASYEEPEGREKTLIDYKQGLSPEGNRHGSGEVSEAVRIELSFGGALMLVGGCAYWVNR